VSLQVVLTMNSEENWGGIEVSYDNFINGICHAVHRTKADAFVLERSLSNLLITAGVLERELIKKIKGVYKGQP